MTGKSWHAGPDSRKDSRSVRGKEAPVDDARRLSKMPGRRVRNSLRRLAVSASNRMRRSARHRMGSEGRTRMVPHSGSCHAGRSLLARTVPSRSRDASRQTGAKQEAGAGGVELQLFPAQCGLAAPWWYASISVRSCSMCASQSARVKNEPLQTAPSGLRAYQPLITPSRTAWIP
jgi:hypothetical protein